MDDEQVATATTMIRESVFTSDLQSSCKPSAAIRCASVTAKCVGACRSGVSACLSCMGGAYSQCCGCLSKVGLKFKC